MMLRLSEAQKDIAETEKQEKMVTIYGPPKYIPRTRHGDTEGGFCSCRCISDERLGVGSEHAQDPR